MTLTLPQALIRSPGNPEHRRHNNPPHRSRRSLMADPVKHQQSSTDNLARQRLPMTRRKERVLSTVNNQRRCDDPANAGPEIAAALEKPVVLHTRLEVPRALDDAADRSTYRCLVERVGAWGRVGPLEFDEILEHRFAIGPVRFGRWSPATCA